MCLGPCCVRVPGTLSEITDIRSTLRGVCCVVRALRARIMATQHCGHDTRQGIRGCDLISVAHHPLSHHPPARSGTARRPVAEVGDEVAGIHDAVLVPVGEGVTAGPGIEKGGEVLDVDLTVTGQVRKTSACIKHNG